MSRPGGRARLRSTGPASWPSTKGAFKDNQTPVLIREKNILCCFVLGSVILMRWHLLVLLLQVRLVQLQLETRTDGDAPSRPPITRTDNLGDSARCRPPSSYAQTISLSLPAGESRDDALPRLLFLVRSNRDAVRLGEVVGVFLGTPESQPIVGVTFTDEHDGLHVRACPRRADGPSSCRTNLKSRFSGGVPIIEVRFPFRPCK